MNFEIKCQNSELWSPIIKDIKRALPIYSHFLKLPKTCEIDILLTNNKTIYLLNQKWRGKNKETDILSFPVSFSNFLDFELERSNFFPLPYYLLGEIVMAYDFIKKESKFLKIPLRSHVLHLLAHGLLHLLGYDHETDSDALLMREQEKLLCNELSIYIR